MTLSIFGSLDDLQDRRLDALGVPLVELSNTTDWESFRPIVSQLEKRSGTSRAGAPRKDVVMMFTGLIIHDLYGLSDDQWEFQ